MPPYIQYTFTVFCAHYLFVMCVILEIVSVFYFKVQKCRRGGTYHEYRDQHHYHHHLYLAVMELHHFLAYSIFIHPLACS